MRLGIDIGSTTIKCALLNDDNEVIQDYDVVYVVKETESFIKGYTGKVRG